MLFSSSTQTNLDADQIEPRSYHLRISQNQYHVDLYIDKMRRNEIFTVTMMYWKHVFHNLTKGKFD